MIGLKYKHKVTGTVLESRNPEVIKQMEKSPIYEPIPEAAPKRVSKKKEA